MSSVLAPGFGPPTNTYAVFNGERRAEPPRREGVGYPPHLELGDLQRREFREALLERNPASADLVERPRVVYTREFDTFSGEEVELLADAAHDDQDGAIYRVAAFTGLRQGELLACGGATWISSAGCCTSARNYTDRRERRRRASASGACP